MMEIFNLERRRMIVLTPQLLIIVSWLCGIICRLEQRQDPIRERVFPPSEKLFPGAAGGYLCWNRCWEQLRVRPLLERDRELPQQPGEPSAQPRSVSPHPSVIPYSLSILPSCKVTCPPRRRGCWRAPADLCSVFVRAVGAGGAERSGSSQSDG